MAVVVSPYIGKGYSGTKDGNPITCNVFGEDLGTPDVDGWTAIDIVDGTSVFDVSSISIEHEVVAVLYKITGMDGGGTMVNVSWHRTCDRKILYTSAVLSRGVANDHVASWIGWTAGEITANEEYYVSVFVTGGVVYRFSQAFTITNMPNGVYVAKRSCVLGEKFYYVGDSGKKRFLRGEHEA